jgi:hypothetical protein
MQTLNLHLHYGKTRYNGQGTPTPVEPFKEYTPKPATVWADIFARIAAYRAYPSLYK